MTLLMVAVLVPFLCWFCKGFERFVDEEIDARRKIGEQP